jgi:hypothetical protein
VLLEEDSDLFLGQAWVDAGDEEVGALVDVAGVAATRATTLSAVAVAAAVLARRGNVTVGLSVGCRVELDEVGSAYRSRPLYESSRMRVSPSRSAPGERERERSPPRGYSDTKKSVDERAQGCRMPALAAVRIDVEVTLTCAGPRIGARSVGFVEILVRADAAIGVGRVSVWHTVIA